MSKKDVVLDREEDTTIIEINRRCQDTQEVPLRGGGDGAKRAWSIMPIGLPQDMVYTDTANQSSEVVRAEGGKPHQAPLLHGGGRRGGTSKRGGSGVPFKPKRCQQAW